VPEIFRALCSTWSDQGCPGFFRKPTPPPPRRGFYMFDIILIKINIAFLSSLIPPPSLLSTHNSSPLFGLPCPTDCVSGQAGIFCPSQLRAQCSELRARVILVANCYCQLSSVFRLPCPTDCVSGQAGVFGPSQLRAQCSELRVRIILVANCYCQLSSVFRLPCPTDCVSGQAGVFGLPAKYF